MGYGCFQNKTKIDPQFDDKNILCDKYKIFLDKKNPRQTYHAINGRP